jgi:hypothetical protein
VTLPDLSANYTIRGIKLAIAGGVFLLLAAGNVVQLVDRHGFTFWFVKIEGAHDKIDRLEAEIEGMNIAQEQSGQLAKTQREANEDEYRDIAADVDRNAGTALDRGFASADRYIRANRVWQWPEGVPCSNAGTAAGGDGAGNPQGAGQASELDGSRTGRGAGARGDGMVVVSAEDVRICTENTVKAEAARDYVTKVEAASRSVPRK